MRKVTNAAAFLFFAAAAAAPAYLAVTNADAQSSYFSSRGCTGCHASPVTATCNGCHQHGNSNLRATTNKTSYAPGETVTVTLSGGSRTGWIGARLYNQSGVEIARPTGNQSGMGGSTTFPAVLSAPAPTAAGSYTWKMTYFGNLNGNNGGDAHGEAGVNVTFTVAAPADTTAPTVGSFTLPATATSLTVPVSAFTASDNVAVTGYLINKSSTAPAANATGWTATAPTSVTAVAGANTFYAWAKDAAGNVSTSRSASVTVTLPDTAAPVVGSFTLPATSTSLTVPVTALAATDDVGVTGYLVNKSTTAPAATATGWTTAAPTTVTAVAGANTFYAWAKDAAGNVSASRSASVTVTLPDATAPSVTAFSLPATSTSLSIPVSSLTASDNVGVTGYLVTTSSAAPAAGATGWTASAPATVTAPAYGSTTFYAWAKDAAGNVSVSRSATVSVVAPSNSIPTLVVSTLADNTYTNNATLNVSGTANDPDGIASVTVNGQPVTLQSNGSFATAVALNAGANTISIVVVDKAGSQAADTRTINYDATAPVLEITAPADNTTTSQSMVNVTGTINETSTVGVGINGSNPSYASITGNTFTSTVYLAPGVNTIDVNATDLAGNVSSAKRTITMSQAQNLTLAVTYPSQDITTSSRSIILKGKVTDALSKVSVKITMNGKTFSPRLYKGEFQQRITFRTPKVYAITVVAKDASGNSSTVTRNVIYAPATSDSDRSDD